MAAIQDEVAVVVRHRAGTPSCKKRGRGWADQLGCELCLGPHWVAWEGWRSRMD